MRAKSQISSRLVGSGSSPPSLPPCVPSQYVYAIPPAATHAGHRADSWDVDKWLKSVAVKVTMRGSRGHIKLVCCESGELFAACPLPVDVPVSTVVEPVIDSSRYFVLRVEDELTRRHAFLGLGFRNRDDASDFKLAVQEHQSRSNRERDANVLRAEYDEKVAEKRKENEQNGVDTASQPGGITKLHDFSLKGTISVTVPGRDSGKKTSLETGDGKTEDSVATIAPPPGAGRMSKQSDSVSVTPDDALPPATDEGWATFDAPKEDETWAEFQS